jgi:hypothetical protein
MNLLSILLLVAVFLIVAALAFYLTVIALLLRKTLFTLGTVNVGVRSIARRVEPLEPVLAEVNKDLTAVRDGLRAVLAKEEAKI